MRLRSIGSEASSEGSDTDRGPLRSMLISIPLRLEIARTGHLIRSAERSGMTLFLEEALLIRRVVPLR